MEDLNLIEIVNDLLNYDPITGFFTRKKITNTKQKIGSLVGTINADGYIHIGIHKKYYKAHRLAWMVTHNCIPIQIDHINGIRNDNRIKNLREASQSENVKNKQIGKNNTSGTMGVNFHKKTKKWQVRIGVNGKKKQIGLFSSLDEAIKARKNAEIFYNFHENHGRK